MVTARPRTAGLVVALIAALLAALSVPAAADHTDPDAPVSPIVGGDAGRPLEPGLERGAGTWQYHRQFSANPSSDHWVFPVGDTIHATSGTLGGGAAGHVGQRILALAEGDGPVDPRFVADHGSAACNQPSATGNLGLQHDASVTPFTDPQLLLDATDSTGRCHDTAGGGIEIVDISGLEDGSSEVREIGLVRFDNTTHTLTVDEQRPWIVYSNNSTTNGAGNYNDVMDLRSCLTASAGGSLPDDADLATKRASCDPVVHRIPFRTEWTQGTRTIDGDPQGVAAGCHDTVSRGDRLYCSGGFGDVILDVGGLTDADGDLNGTPLDCTRLDDVAGEDTGASVTDCTGNPNPDDAQVDGLLADLGVEFLGNFNHVGPDFLPPPFNPAFGLNNRAVPADEGVVFSHETRPLPAGVGGDREFMVVTDERGGGALPGGATCTDNSLDGGLGNGGLHFLDITDPANIEYAQTVEGGEAKRAVWRGEVVLPSANFCVIHRIQVLEDEQRIIMGYYSQGVKILDYDLDEDGNFVFDEVASMILPGANSWTTAAFRITDNDDGTRTYDLLSSDIQRGIDVFSWTGPTATPVPVRDGDGGDGDGDGDDERACPGNARGKGNGAPDGCPGKAGQSGQGGERSQERGRGHGQGAEQAATAGPADPAAPTSSSQGDLGDDGDEVETLRAVTVASASEGSGLLPGWLIAVLGLGLLPVAAAVGRRRLT